MSDSLSRELARYVTQLTYEELPQDVIDATKLAVLDWLGSAVVGSRTAPAQLMHRVIRAQDPELYRYTREASNARDPGSTNAHSPAKPRGTGATLIGAGQMSDAPQDEFFATKTSLLMAVLGNGTSSHVIELDDVHKASILHAGTTVIPAALAVAEYTHASGRQLIEAIVAGFDVSIRIGEAVTPSHYEYFHTTGTVGTFGAATAAAKLLGLTEEQTMHALGSAGTQAAGLWEFVEDGAMSKHLHSGKAGMNGVLSGLLAEQGFTAANAIIEGRRGFMAAMASTYDAGLVTKDLGSNYKILENCYKIHSSCRHTHPSIDMALALAKGHDIDANEINRIDVGTYQVALDITDNAHPNTTYAAKFSLQYCVAVALSSRQAGLTAFEEPLLNDTTVRKLLDRVHVFVDTEIEAAYPQKWGAKVTVHMKDGTVWSLATDYPKGDFENPVSAMEIQNKFAQLAKDYLLDTVADIFTRRCLSLETVTDIADFFSL